MKILLLMMSMLNFIYKPTYDGDFLIDVDNKELIEDENIIINNNGNISFYFNSIFLCNIKCANYSYLIDNDYFYITFIDDNNLYIRKYDNNAKIVKNVKFNDSIYTDSKLKIMKNDNSIVLFSTVNDNNYTDLKIIELDDKLNNTKNAILKGELNDSFYDCEYFQEHYYLLIKHDKMSGGDFGYGGTLVLSLLDLDYNVLKNRYFNADYAKISINNDSVVSLITNQGTYAYDLALEAKFGLLFPHISLFWSKSYNELYLSLLEDRLEIYEILYDDVNNINYFHLLKTYNYNLDNQYLCEVVELNKRMYLKFSDDYQYYLYELNIYDTRNFINEVNYLTAFNDINQYIDSWYQRLYLEKEGNNYNADVYGTYEISYVNGNFKKNMTINVFEEANVMEDMIYPIGYKLYFTGVALLNNKMIHNNYSIDKEGKYTLELYSNTKEKKIINFTVSNQQSTFQDYSLKKSDFSAYVNQDVTLEYRLDEKEDINKIIIDDKEYHDYSFKDHILKINFNHDKSGFYHHKINYIDDIEINDLVSFNIIDDDLSLYFNLIEDKKKIKIDYYNDNNNLRLFNLYLDDKLYKSYPISENNIILPYESNYRLAKITLTYANNDGSYSSYDLASFILSDAKSSELLNIEINKKEEAIKEFSFVIKNKKNIEKIKCEDKIIYEKKQDDNKSSLYLLIFLIIINIISYSYYLFKILKINIKRIFNFKKKKDNISI